MSEALSIRLPRDMAKRLDRLAKELERSKAYIVRKALQEYIEEYGDYLVALRRLSDKEDTIITEAELAARLGSQNSFFSAPWSNQNREIRSHA